MEKKEIITSYKVYYSESELSFDDRALLALAKKAAKNAYAPYSEFYVGAAVQLDNGMIFSGNNQENSAYPSGLCAERVAIFAAMSQNKNVPIKAIAITAQSPHFSVDAPVSPCGSCRQVIAEYENLFNNPVRIILSGDTGHIHVFESIESLLPLSFKASAVKK